MSTKDNQTGKYYHQATLRIFIHTATFKYHFLVELYAFYSLRPQVYV